MVLRDLEENCHDYRRFFCTGCGHVVDVPVHCGNRFCDVCGKSRHYKARRKIKLLINSLALHPGSRLKMLTLSVQNTDDLESGVEHLISSFRRLRQRKYWKSHVYGGLLVVEVSGASGNWHPHLHVLIESKYLKWDKIHKDWCDVSGGIGVYISNINSEKAVNYVTKYMTKTETQGNDTQIASAALKGKRLFQPFGLWHSLCNSIPNVKYSCPKCGNDELIWERLIRFDRPIISNIRKRDPCSNDDMKNAILKECSVVEKKRPVFAQGATFSVK